MPNFLLGDCCGESTLIVHAYCVSKCVATYVCASAMWECLTSLPFMCLQTTAAHSHALFVPSCGEREVGRGRISRAR